MKTLTIQDLNIIKPYLDLANYEGYNSNFITMMMWKHEYHVLYEIKDHFLVMLNSYKGENFWSMPFTTPEYYKEAIEYMIHYSNENHFPFVIDCAIESFVDIVKNIYHNKLIYKRIPDYDDYIYDRNLLVNLTGKKMQKRRNHYNAFIKNYPQYYYRDLDSTKDFDNILKCLMKWESKKGKLEESVTSEIYGIMNLLSYKDSLNFEVGGIFINDTMEAFIIGSPLNHSTVQIHVEKANAEIRGLYPAICKEFLQHHFTDYLYINREEDLGIENLRKAKKALNPIKMINKYQITLSNIEITQPNDKEINQIKKLWIECFDDENFDSTELYFKYFYKKKNTYVLKNNNQIISALQIKPINIIVNNEKIKSYFIVGVCTNSMYQRQGLMKILLDYVLDIYKDYPIYLQAYNRDIYRSFNFHASHHHQIVVLDQTSLKDEKLELSTCTCLMKKYYNQMMLQYNYYKNRSNNDWDLLLKRIKTFNESYLIFKDSGYIIFKENNQEIYINELIYINDDELKRILNYLKSFNKKIIIECDLKADIKGDKSIVITMMSNQINEDIVNESYFINEIY